MSSSGGGASSSSTNNYSAEEQGALTTVPADLRAAHARALLCFSHHAVAAKAELVAFVERCNEDKVDADKFNVSFVLRALDDLGVASLDKLCAVTLGEIFSGQLDNGAKTIIAVLHGVLTYHYL